MSNFVTIVVKDKIFSSHSKTYTCGAATVTAILGAYIPEQERGFCCIHIQTTQGEALHINYPKQEDTAKLSRVIQPGETVTILKLPGILGVLFGPATLAIKAEIAGAALAAFFTSKAFLTIMALVHLGVTLYAMFESFKFDHDERDDDPRLDSGSNRARTYGSCIEIFGKRKVTPPLAANETIETTRRNQYLKNVYDFGVGKVTLEEEKIGPIPFDHYDEVASKYYEGSWDGRIGSAGVQPNDPNAKNYLSIYQRQRRRDSLFFNDIGIRRDDQRVGGVDIASYRKGGPRNYENTDDATRGALGSTYLGALPSRATPHYTLVTQQRTKEVLITFDWLSGLYTATETHTGDAQSTCLFLYRRHGTGVLWRYGGWMHYKEAKNGRFQEDHRIVFATPDTWEIRVYAWKDRAARGKDTRIDSFSIIEMISVREDTDVLNTKRDHAIKEVRIKATDQLQGTLQAYNAIAQRHLPVPSSDWATTDSSVQPTSSPAAAGLYLLRQNPRIKDEDIDLASFEEWHNWCEEEIPVPFIENNRQVTRNVKRNQYNDILQSDMTLKSALSRIGQAGDAAILYVDNKWTVVRDFPDVETPPEYILTEANTFGFEINRNFPKLHHALQVSYIDPDRDWEETEVVMFADGYEEEEDTDRGIKAATLYREIETIGVTSRAGAARKGYIALTKAKLRNTQYKIGVGIEGMGMYPGQIVRLAIPDIRVKNEHAGVDERIIQGRIFKTKASTVTDLGVTYDTHSFILDISANNPPFNNLGGGSIKGTLNISAIPDTGPKAFILKGNFSVSGGFVEFQVNPLPSGLSSTDRQNATAVAAGDTFSVQFEQTPNLRAKIRGLPVQTTHGTETKDVFIEDSSGLFDDRQYGIDCIVRSIQFDSENFTGQVVLEQAALQEFKNADIGLVPQATIGTNYGNVDRRNLAPPPCEITQAFFTNAKATEGLDSLLAIQVFFEPAAILSDLSQQEIRTGAGLFLDGTRRVNNTLTINTEEIETSIQAELDRLDAAYPSATTPAAIAYGWSRNNIPLQDVTTESYDLASEDEGSKLQAFIYVPTEFTGGAWVYDRSYPGFAKTRITRAIGPDVLGAQLEYSNPTHTIIEYATYDPMQASEDYEGGETEDNTIPQTLSWRSHEATTSSGTAYLPVDSETVTYVLRARNFDVQGNPSVWSDRFFVAPNNNVKLSVQTIYDDKPHPDDLVVVHSKASTENGRTDDLGLIPIQRIFALDVPPEESELMYNTVGEATPTIVSTLPPPNHSDFFEARAYFPVIHNRNREQVRRSEFGGRDIHEVTMIDAERNAPQGGTSRQPYPLFVPEGTPTPLTYDSNYVAQPGWRTNPFDFYEDEDIKQALLDGKTVHVFMSRRILLNTEGIVYEGTGGTQYEVELGAEDNTLTPTARNEGLSQLEWTEPVHVYDLVAYVQDVPASYLRADDVAVPDNYTQEFTWDESEPFVISRYFPVGDALNGRIVEATTLFDVTMGTHFNKGTVPGSTEDKIIAGEFEAFVDVVGDPFPGTSSWREASPAPLSISMFLYREDGTIWPDSAMGYYDEQGTWRYREQGPGGFRFNGRRGEGLSVWLLSWAGSNEFSEAHFVDVRDMGDGYIYFPFKVGPFPNEVHGARFLVEIRPVSLWTPLTDPRQIERQGVTGYRQYRTTNLIRGKFSLKS